MKAPREECLLALALSVFSSGLIQFPRRDRATLTFCDLPLILTEGQGGTTCRQVRSQQEFVS
ncbi:MAG: hypothetical protein KME25_21360 [Symplocastrum torsivum CPER-KK1]|uniref:Uncharacterized protein n=1 Tax=Symplocastrum torsivum CPER-KK1 TaxID=450513 RepID=A0A951PNL2_9CYAN|nr:hypothetical protein [Symplocastrum torsivum CPER-KK1]